MLFKKIKNLLLSSFLLPIVPILSISDDGDQSSDDGKSNQDDNKNDKNDNIQNDAGKENKTDNRVIFDSQEDFDALISSRVNKAVQKTREEMKAEKDKENMTEIEKIRAEKEEADKKALAATIKANRTLIKAEVISQATKLNIVDPSAAFALMDLDNVSIDDNGNVKGVNLSLKALIKEKSYLIGENVVKSSGDDQNAGTGKKKKNFDMNQLIRRAAGRGD
jgi:hypothetical protein